MRLLQAEELFRKVLEVGSKNKATRLLGLDVGSKYVGVSVSDEKNRIALPLSVLCRTKTNVNLMADDFKTLVSKYSIAGFVVGYPFNLHGLPSPDVKCPCFMYNAPLFYLKCFVMFSFVCKSGSPSKASCWRAL